MKAIALHQHGGVDALHYETLPTPDPGPGEVLVRVRAAGVNHIDLDIRNGSAGIASPFPHVMGVDAVGEVAALGTGVEEWQLGERVVPHFILHCGSCADCTAGRENTCQAAGILGATVWGTYAEYVKVGRQHLVRVPDGPDDAEAVSAYIPFATAWEALIEVGHLQGGETLLINAVGSGVGSAGLQVAALTGARIIATAGSAAKLERARAAGAEGTINYRDEPIEARVRDLTEGRGVDCVFDCVGGNVLQQSIAALAPGGRLLSVGAHAGEVVPVDMIQLFRKHATLHGCGRSTRAIGQRVLELVAEGKLQPVIQQRFSLADAGAAQTLIESREVYGRLVLEP